jgi:hypothetical protein
LARENSSPEVIVATTRGRAALDRRRNHLPALSRARDKAPGAMAVFCTQCRLLCAVRLLHREERLSSQVEDSMLARFENNDGDDLVNLMDSTGKDTTCYLTPHEIPFSENEQYEAGVDFAPFDCRLYVGDR